MHLPDWFTRRPTQITAHGAPATPALTRRSFAKRLGLLLGVAPVAPAAAAKAREATAVETGHNTSGPSTQPLGPTYQRLKAYLDSVPAIDTHAHLYPFDQLLPRVETPRGREANLAGLWHSSYYQWTGLLPPWTPNLTPDDWWSQAKGTFANSRAVGFYRAMRVAFQDLYGLDFNTLSDQQARDLDRRITENYRTPDWLYNVITKRANIELEFEDPYWARLDLRTAYRFGVLVFNVTTLVDGVQLSLNLNAVVRSPFDDPAIFAKKWGMAVNSLDDYLLLVDRIFAEAKQQGAACLKSTLAYARTLQFDNVPKERAALAFARPVAERTPDEAKALEDFLMWRLAESSAKHGLPFQIHTGLARIEGSNPLLLVPLIRANPQTKFILFHGGFPWVGETGAIAFEFKNVWIDCNWLPMVSYSTARQAFQEWLDLIPTNRIMWGSDSKSAEEIYGAAKLMRACWAEVLAERVQHGDLNEQQAQRIGRQVLRENALEMFPQLRERLKTQAA
jgi:predicted TIM-barrel fold metal-dependent hydrolase